MKEERSMTSTVWDPFGALAGTSHRFDSTLDRDGLVSGGTWVPAVDIYGGDGHDFKIVVELPDVRREDIQITVEDNTLAVCGEKKVDPAMRNDRVQRIERNYGTFRRAFTLPRTVDAANVRAEYRDGVLTLSVPMREEAKPRPISIKAS
jgi:HSP20 family protein